MSGGLKKGRQTKPAMTFMNKGVPKLTSRQMRRRKIRGGGRKR